MLKYLFILSLLLSFAKNSFSTPNTVSGIGCNLGNRIYTQKIGTSTFWGTQYDVYKSTGPNYPINWNNTSVCDQINANSISQQGSQCWVNSYVNPTNNSSGASYGSLYSYSYEICNVPIDDYIVVFLGLFGGIGAYYIVRKGSF